MIVPNLAAVKLKVLERLLIVDDSVLRLDDTEVEDAVRDGLDQLNIVAPVENVYQVAGDGTKKRFEISDDIALWVKSISHVANVSFVTDPDTDDEFIHLLRKESWNQSLAADGKEILTTGLACPSGNTIRVNWDTHSTVEDLDGAAAPTTIPERYTEAFYLYATYGGAIAVTRKAARLKQSSLGGDITSLSEVYERWVEIARSLKKQADSRIGSIRGSVQGITQTGDWKTRSRFGTGGRISHA